jgi:hypothetical protein
LFVCLFCSLFVFLFVDVGSIPGKLLEMSYLKVAFLCFCKSRV